MMQTRIPSSTSIQTSVRRPVVPVRTQPRGAAAVEFAIVLPLLVTVLLGATDFGRLSHSTIAIANAARSGAEYASMNPFHNSTQAAWIAGTTQAVSNELSQSAAFDTSKLVVVVSNVEEAGGLRRVGVEVTYPFETMITWPSLPSSFDLRQTVVLRGLR